MRDKHQFDGIAGKLQEWYARRARLEGAQVTRFEQPASGVVNETYVHSVSYHREGRLETLPAVLRVQPLSDDTPIPNVDVKQQAFVLRKLSRAKGIPTPKVCLLYTSPSPRDRTRSRMPSSA